MLASNLPCDRRHVESLGTMNSITQQSTLSRTLQRDVTLEPPPSLTHLDALEAESIHVIREAMAEGENPVLLYSIGKDSSVLLHLGLKAFYPSRHPMPV
jgi:sulfate adenylyltransferase subunit 2